MSRCPKMVRMGTMKIPLAIPSIPPSALAPRDTANSHNANPQFICGRSSVTRGTAAQSSHKLNLVAVVVELLIVNGLMAFAVGSPFNAEYGTAGGDLQSSGDDGIGGHGLQAVFGLNQR